MRVLDTETEEEKNKIHLDNGLMIDDPRLPYFYLPNEIDWPFSFSQNNSDEKNTDNKINDKYVVNDLLSITSKGGVYNAHYQNKDFILKEYRPHVRNVNNLTGYDVFKNEVCNYNEFSSYDFVPKLIENFQEWEHYFLVIEKINGHSLTSLISKNTKIYLDAKYKEDFLEKAINIIEQIINIIFVFHNNDYVIGDISSENFLLDDNGKVYVIDLESCNKVYNSENNFIGSKGFYYPNVQTSFSGKKKDLIALGFLMMKLFSNSNYLININYDLVISNFRYVKDKIGLPEYIFDIIELLINTNIQTNINDIKLAFKTRDTFHIKLKNVCSILEEEFPMYTATCTIKDNIFNEITNYSENPKDIFDKFISENNFRLDTGALSIALKEINNEACVKDIEYYLDNLFNRIEYDDDLILGYPINNTKNYSYYLFNGISEYIYILQIIGEHHLYKNLFDKYKFVYKEILKIFDHIIIYKTEFAEGIAGIIHILINEYKYSPSSSTMKTITHLCENLLAMGSLLEKEMTFPDNYFEEMGSDFKNGKKGLLLVLNEVLTCIK
ncbi:protein kinase domain-containing protein [Macrococcoides caseolyticum]|uniref:protein kinase domain-containing protein n=1 Tax=Macrococcoides caseolyticum TaxID=69966 RepID=UPI000E0F479A|nr:lanthionine synthetase LanC family protein [Macrococcus caseolyticus]